MNVIKECLNAVDKLKETNDHSVTYFIRLGEDDKNNWAIVLAWMDWDGNNNWEIYGKVAYQPKNSICQCDYDIDWLMPTFNNEVWDTEIANPNEEDFRWMIKEYSLMKK